MIRYINKSDDMRVKIVIPMEGVVFRANELDEVFDKEFPGVDKKYISIELDYYKKYHTHENYFEEYEIVLTTERRLLRK